MIRTLSDLVTDLSRGAPADRTPAAAPGPPRLFGIWEITTWILPMAAEHFRRTLAAHPDLPQGRAETAGGTRWFTAAEVMALRAVFEARAPGRYRQEIGRPKVLTLAAPLGAGGRSTVAAHLAVAAALDGWRVLVVEADPAGGLAEVLEGRGGSGLTGGLARAAADALRRHNADRVDRGAAPMPIPEALARPDTAPAMAASRWPGLDLVPGGAALAELEVLLPDWERLVPGWTPRDGLAAVLAGWRAEYDLILIDPPRGLGPLAMACLAACDLLLVPGPEAGLEHRTGASPEASPGASPGAGLEALHRVLERRERAEAARADALGLPPPDRRRPRALAVPIGAGGGAFPRLPDPGGLFWDRDYRDLGKLAYTPVRDALAGCWSALAAALAGMDETARAPSIRG